MVFGISKGRGNKQMRSYLINKNLCLYYWLRRRIAKNRAFWVASIIEKIILIFGREEVAARVV
jgi:hypothetical protein